MQAPGRPRVAVSCAAGRDESFEQQSGGTSGERGGCRDEPEAVWCGREREASERTAGRPAELEREAVQREVAAERARFREVGDESVLHGAVEALAEAEDAECSCEDDGGPRAGQPPAAGEDDQPATAQSEPSTL